MEILKKIQIISVITVALLALTGEVYAAQVDKDTLKLIQQFEPTEQELKAGASVLEYIREVKVGENNLRKTRQKILIAVLDDIAADDYSKIITEYNEYFVNKSLKVARVIDKKGSFQDISKDAIVKGRSTNELFYDDIINLRFSLPAVEVGKFIHLEYLIEDVKPIIPGHWDYSTGFYYFKKTYNNRSLRADPVRYSSVTVEVLGSKEIRSYVNDKSVKHEKLSDSMMRWTKYNLSEKDPEKYALEILELYPFLRVTSLQSWSEIDKWASKQYLTEEKYNAEIVEVLGKIIKPGMTKKEKIEAVYYYVQDNIRYVFAHVNRGGYKPHSANEVLKNKYGDCKDQTILIRSLLLQLGIKSYPALISGYPGSRINSDFPFESFNHIITYIPDMSGDIWLDTSGETGKYPGIGWRLNGRKSFVITGKGGQIKKIKGGNSNSEIDIEILNRRNDKDLEIDIKIKAKGEVSNYWYSINRYQNEKDDFFKRLVKSLYSKGKLEEINVIRGADGHDDIEIHSKLLFSELWEENDNKMSFSVSLSSIMDAFQIYGKLPEEENRKFDLSFNEKYIIRYRNIIERPSSEYVFIDNESAASNMNPYFRFESTSEIKKDKKIIQLTFVENKSTVKRENYKEFLELYNNAIKHGYSTVTVYKDEAIDNKDKLLAGISNTEKAEDRIKVIKVLLENTEYEKANELADKMTKSHPGSGEAWFLLGLSFGYLNNEDLSEQAIQKSIDLGYDPW